MSYKTHPACSGCKRSVSTAKKVKPEEWKQWKVPFNQAGIAFLCTSCRMDIKVKGQWTGKGWTWLKARKKEEAENNLKSKEGGNK